MNFAHPRWPLRSFSTCLAAQTRVHRLRWLALRTIGTALVALSAITCSDTPHAPVRQTAGTGRLAFAPVFSKAAAEVYAQRATFAAVNFDRVRIVLVRPPSDTIKDTTIVFSPNTPDQTIELTVDVTAPGEIFDGAIDYSNNGSVVFRGRAKFQAHAADEPAPTPQAIVLEYVGVGRDAARVVITPATPTVSPNGPMTFTADVFDATNNKIAGVPLTWSSSDASIATIDDAGTMRPTGKRGSVTITARTLTNVAGSATATVILPASAMVVTSGGGQSGKAGAALPTAATVRIIASDGVGIPSLTVNFAAPTGGSVGATSVVTNADGYATTSLRLGSLAGPQSFAASGGGFSVSIPATATAADPAAIAVVSGSGQQDSVKRTLKSPFVAKVTDTFGNAVSGASVSWSRTAGEGTVGSATSVSSADGLASVGYTLGAAAGEETVVASIAGANATFSANAIAASPGVIVAVSPPSQPGRVAQQTELTVKVTDVNNNPVQGVPVSWSATNGTISPTTTTDAKGTTSNTLTVGSSVGGASATASIGGGKSVTFTVNVQAGIVSKLAIRVPQSTAAGAAMTPSVQVELQDAGGNITQAANAVTIALGANPGQSALTGTLTKAAVNGVATFDDLKLNRPGAGYTLVATSAGVSPITSTAMTVTPGASAQIELIEAVTGNVVAGTPSVNITAGAAPPANMIVGRLLDVAGNVVPNVDVNVTETWVNGGSGGPRTTDANGRFTLLVSRLRTTGTASVTASRSGVTSRTINITVVPAPPSYLTFDQTTLFPRASLPASFTARIRDSVGNVIDVGTGATLPVTLGIANGPGGSFSFGGGPINAVGGVVQFPAFVLGPAGSFNLQVTSPGLTAGPATATVSAAPSIAYTDSLNRNAIGGSTVLPSPTVLVSAPGPVPLQNIAVRFTASAGSINFGAGAVTTGQSLTNASGNTAPQTWTAPLTPGTYTVVADFAGSRMANGNPLPSVTYSLNVGSNGPSLMGPADQSTFSIFPRTTTLSWDPVPGAVSYEVEISACVPPFNAQTYVADCAESNGWFVTTAGAGATGPSYTFDFVGAQPGRWRVRARYANGSFSPYSVYRHFFYTI